MISERIGWAIYRRGCWVARHVPSGAILTAPTRAALNSKINAFDKDYSK